MYVALIPYSFKSPAKEIFQQFAVLFVVRLAPGMWKVEDDSAVLLLCQFLLTLQASSIGVQYHLHTCVANKMKSKITKIRTSLPKPSFCCGPIFSLGASESIILSDSFIYSTFLQLAITYVNIKVRKYKQNRSTKREIFDILQREIFSRFPFYRRIQIPTMSC